LAEALLLQYHESTILAAQRSFSTSHLPRLHTYDKSTCSAYVPPRDQCLLDSPQPQVVSCTIRSQRVCPSFSEMEKEENAPERALRGLAQDIEFGEWIITNRKKIVVFRGNTSASSCFVRDGEGRVVTSVEGFEEQEIIVSPGEKVYAMHANIRFKPYTE